jgi:hypothetical protein
MIGNATVASASTRFTSAITPLMRSNAKISDVHPTATP